MVLGNEDVGTSPPMTPRDSPSPPGGLAHSLPVLSVRTEDLCYPYLITHHGLPSLPFPELEAFILPFLTWRDIFYPALWSQNPWIGPHRWEGLSPWCLQESPSTSGHNFHLHSCFPLEGLYSAGMSVQQCNTALFSFSLFSTFTLICRSLRRKLAAFFQWEESASPCWVSCSVTDVYFHVSDLHAPSLLEPHKFYCVLPWHPPKPFLFALSQRPLVLLFLFSFLSGNFQLTLAPASLLFCWL